MFRLCSKGCEHALRALTSISSLNHEKIFSLKKICKENEIPESFTRKMFQALVHKRILAATQGPGGGYRFCTPPQKISILKIIEAVDGQEALGQCVLGFSGCSEDHCCALHPLWKRIRSNVISKLENMTLQQLMKLRKRDESVLKKEENFHEK